METLKILKRQSCFLLKCLRFCTRLYPISSFSTYLFLLQLSTETEWQTFWRLDTWRLRFTTSCLLGNCTWTQLKCLLDSEFTMLAFLLRWFYFRHHCFLVLMASLLVMMSVLRIRFQATIRIILRIREEKVSALSTWSLLNLSASAKL